MTTLYDDGNVILTFDPLRGRDAELTAGDTDGQYLPEKLTRPRALEIADALLTFACTPDPGPGAPYPLREAPSPGRGISVWESYHVIGYSSYAPTLMAQLEGAR
jgi:hypothetical protein